MNHAKRNEWLELISEHPEGIDPINVFLKNARRETSAFHDDFVWDERAAAKEYYHKRAAQLVVYYSTLFNTVTADQRLHLVIPQRLSEKKIRRKIAKTAATIAQDEFEFLQARAAIWTRLRRVLRDLEDFAPFSSELKNLRDQLMPIIEGEQGRKVGAAAQ